MLRMTEYGPDACFTAVFLCSMVCYPLIHAGPVARPSVYADLMRTFRTVPMRNINVVVVVEKHVGGNPTSILLTDATANATKCHH